MDMNYDPLFPLADPQERVPERMTNRSRPQISITDRDLGMDESAEMPEEAWSSRSSVRLATVSTQRCLHWQWGLCRVSRGSSRMIPMLHWPAAPFSPALTSPSWVSRQSHPSRG